MGQNWCSETIEYVLVSNIALASRKNSANGVYGPSILGIGHLGPFVSLPFKVGSAVTKITLFALVKRAGQAWLFESSPPPVSLDIMS